MGRHHTRAAWAGFASIALGAAVTAGCNLIVSAGDYRVGEDGADATAATDARVVDSTPPPADHRVPDVGPQDAGGPDTDQPDTNLPDATPACGSTLPTTTTDFKQLVKACVLHFACSPTADSTGGATAALTIGTCIGEDDLGLFGATACEKSAQNCADITACSGYGFATAAECDGGAYVACDSNGHAVNCDPTSNSEGYPGYFVDCAHQGGACKTYKDLEAGASAPLQVGCEVVAKCTDPNDTEHCSGTSIDYVCVNGVGYGFNCNNFATHCEPAAPGCYYNAASCDAGIPACNGPTKEICPSDGTQLQLYHCEHAGLGCMAGTTDAGTIEGNCVAPGCDPAACTEACNGDTLHACVGGAPLDIDCQQYGYHCRVATLFNVNGDLVDVPRCLP